MGERKYQLIEGWNEPRTFWNNPQIRIPKDAKIKAVSEYMTEHNLTELSPDDISMALLLYQIRWLRAFSAEMARKISPRMKKAGMICRDWADALERGIKQNVN